MKEGEYVKYGPKSYFIIFISIVMFSIFISLYVFAEPLVEKGLLDEKPDLFIILILNFLAGIALWMGISWRKISLYDDHMEIIDGLWLYKNEDTKRYDDVRAVLGLNDDRYESVFFIFKSSGDYREYGKENIVTVENPKPLEEKTVDKKTFLKLFKKLDKFEKRYYQYIKTKPD